MRDNIRKNGEFMKYRSCHLIEHGISIDVDSIKACCLSRDFDKGQLMIVPKYENNKIFWDDLLNIKSEQRKAQQTADLPACEGCYNLREEDWDEENYISYINFDHWSECNSKCLYCGVRNYKPKTKNNVLNAVKELIKSGKFRNTGEITFQGGEPTVLKEFDPLLNLFIKAGSKVRIHSSGILFSRAIREGLKKGAVCVVISPDSASSDIYRRIKSVDKSDKVWANIKHYRKNLKNDLEKEVRVKYIIIPGVNDTLEEVNKFLNKIKELDIKSVIVDVEYTYANRNTGNISPHVYMLMDYIENFAQKNNIDYDLYDSAKYAIRERKIEKFTRFDDIENEFKKLKRENEEKNILY